MTNFEKWDKEFRTQNLHAFNYDTNGLLWLKVRAVCRSRQIEKFIAGNNIALTATKIAEQNMELLVDTTDMRQSWKMKRAFSLIEPKVNDYLNNFNGNSLKEIYFTFKKNSYKSLADVIFVVKES